MGLFDWFTDSWNDISSDCLSDTSESMMEMSEINPATGLPMIDGIGSIDVGGSCYGFDSHSTMDMDDSFSTIDTGCDFSNDFGSSWEG